MKTTPMRHVTSLALGILALSAALHAQEPGRQPVEVYTKVTLAELQTLGGSWPPADRWGWVPVHQQLQTCAILTGSSEGFLVQRPDGQADAEPGGQRAATLLVARSLDTADVTGVIVVSPPFGAGEVSMVRIRIPKEKMGNATEKDYLEAAHARFSVLAGAGLPGAAWFRFQLASIEQRQGVKPGAGEARTRNLVRTTMDSSDELQETYDFFSAGRAVSENLRLDRSLAPIEGGEPTIPIGDLKGIDTKAFDWKPLVAKLSPAKDPLAAIIPADQHAFFFPSLAALGTVLDSIEAQGAPIVMAATDRPEDGGTRMFYERQLGFHLVEFAKNAFMGALVKSVAITGSDPYFATGTDVAFLIETKVPAVLGAMETNLGLHKAEVGGDLARGEIAGVSYVGLTSGDGLLSSYVSKVGDAVVLTNSLAQLKRLAETSAGAIPALAASDEYVFFRDRYPRTDPAETAFILLTDATIRRWCGPRWRIGDARRTRAAAQLAQLTAENCGAIVRSQLPLGPYVGSPPPPGLRPLVWIPGGIHSDAWGNLQFLKPIVELDVSKVTKAEADAYEQFRGAYQRRWAQYFDPIAIKLSLGATSMSADVTVMPLVESSDYRELMDIGRAAKFPPTACDPHDGVLIHFTLAVDATAAALAKWERGAHRLAPNLESLALAWLKGGVSICLEQDPVLEHVDPDRFEELLRVLPRLPLMLNAEVKDPVALGLLLTAIRAGMEDTSLGSVKWTKGSHRDVPTMTISGIEGPGDDTLSIRYAIVDGVFAVTLREDLLHRAIDRALDRRAGKASGQPWLGESAALRVDRRIVDLDSVSSRRWWEESQRELAWRALPILLEWHRIFPGDDPVAVHEKLFKVRLVDPAGGRYVVDKDGLRIISETFGHPAETRPVPKKTPPLLEGLKEARGGLTFEHDGVRARVAIEREAK